MNLVQSIRSVTMDLVPFVIIYVYDFINTYEATDVSRRQAQNVPYSSKNVKIFELHDHIWIHLEKSVQQYLVLVQN